MTTLTDDLVAIDGISDRLAGEIASTFPTAAALRKASVDDLTTIRGIGPVLADRIRANLAPDTTSSAGRTGTRSLASGSAVAQRADRAATTPRRGTTRTPLLVDTVAAPADKPTSTTETFEGSPDPIDEPSAVDDFADGLPRRRLGPVTLPNELPFPFEQLLDLTRSVVALGLDATTSVLGALTRRLR